MTGFFFILLLVATVIMAGVFSFQLSRKNVETDQLVRGNLCAAAGLVMFSSLLLPWIRLETTVISGIDVGLFFFKPLRLIMLFISLLAILVTTAGFLSLTGYNIGTRIVLASSLIALVINSSIVLALSYAPIWQELISTIDWGILMCLAGSLIGIVGGILKRGPERHLGDEPRPRPNPNRRNLRQRTFRLRRTQTNKNRQATTRRRSASIRLCPACNRNRLREDQDICDECGRKLTRT